MVAMVNDAQTKEKTSVGLRKRKLVDAALPKQRQRRVVHRKQKLDHGVHRKVIAIRDVQPKEKADVKRKAHCAVSNHSPSEKRLSIE